ncbi:MAG: histidine phosphatase family protein, partial [Synergistes sp.]|nr:histidine phosphatase family protein [Synergistes sp.]
PALREINLGEWEGRTFDEVREQFKEIYENRGKHYSEIAPPGGENFLELQQRVLPAFDKIASSCDEGNILIIGHGAAIWSIMSAHFGFNLDHWLFFPQEYCGIHVLEPYCGRFKISRYNWSPTLTN